MNQSAQKYTLTDIIQPVVPSEQKRRKMQKTQKSRRKAQKERQAALSRSKPLQIRSGSGPLGPRRDVRTASRRPPPVRDG